ncbi:MAG: ABC transporter permease [Lachnospirales bacterium]
MKILKRWLPFLSSIISLGLELFIRSVQRVKINYYLYVIIAVAVFTFLWAVASYFNKNLEKKLNYKGEFWFGVILLINIYNLVTVKFGLLPVVYFPSPAKIIGVIFEDSDLIVKCLIYSSRLLFFGVLFGGVVGLFTGIAIGFNKKAAYWINPLVRFLGPIPSTAWIPVVLVVFPDTISASSFMIALAVWFPVTLMTSSGIANISNSFFEVSQTLGASTLYKIFKVGVPAAMPSIFIGFFNGLCSAFITLMTAEMIGAKYGIGWYVNWQKEMMCYANVYAGLIVIAVTFSIIITIIFRVKDKILVWQKGVIKW